MIKRYKFNIGSVEEDPNGEWVRFDDAIALADITLRERWMSIINSFITACNAPDEEDDENIEIEEESDINA